MSNDTDQQLLRFLRNNIFTQRTAGVCREIVLRHAGQKSDAEVNRFEVENQHRTEEGVQQLFTDIVGMALADGAGWGGTQTYKIVAYHGDDPKPSARFVYRVDGSRDDDETEDEGSSEPANAKGLTAQLMRHNETLMKTMMGSMSQIVNSMQRAMSRQSERIEIMERERWTNFQTMEQFASGAHERAMEMRRIELAEESKRAMIQKLGVLIPVVAAKMLNAKTPAQKAEAATQQSQELIADDVIATSIKTLLASLSDEQRNTIFGSLTPDQSKALKSESAEQIKQVLPTLNESQRATIFGALNGEQQALLLETTNAIFN